MNNSSSPSTIRAALDGDAADRVAVWTSVTCAVHCALMPLVLPLLPYALGGVVGQGTEQVFRGAAFVLGVLSLGHSYRVVHRQWTPLLLFAAGMALLFLAATQTAMHRGREIALVLIGASTIISAHVHNLRLRRDRRGAGTCGCACHEE